MLPDAYTCYRALSARDPRFDGVFFVGVTTTGIYCRPVCPARLPAPDRCRFFGSAAAAEAKGFRPCLRCRPERAPGRSTVDATRSLAARAAARIAAGALNEGGVQDLAAGLHVGSRQLRRAVRKEYGVTPVQLAQTHRLLLAKRLLTESDLPMTRVAFASGFGSLRRFNALFRKRYRMSPGDLRREGRTNGSVPAATLTLRLDYRPPLDWDALLTFLGTRAIPGVEYVDGRRYVRTVYLGGHEGWIAAAPGGSPFALDIEISLSLLPVLMPLLSRLRSLFDLDAEPEVIQAHLARDPVLEPYLARRPGLRVPGALDGFELAWRAVLGQQVSVAAAGTLAARFAEAFSEPAEQAPQGLRLLPVQAGRVAGTPVDRVMEVGIPQARAMCIVELARAIVDRTVRLEPGSDPDAVIARLQGIRGIGPWTAQYVALRGLHWPDAFPHGDLGIRRGLGGLSGAEAKRAAEPWRPWRAYAALHLWQGLSGA